MSRGALRQSDQRSDQRGRSFVYFAQSPFDPDRIKIGYSRSPGRRIRGLSDRHHLLAAVPGTLEHEAGLHHHFAEYRCDPHKEYFWFTDELRSFVDWLTRQPWIARDDSEEALNAAHAPVDWLPWMQPTPRVYDDQMLLPLKGMSWEPRPLEHTSDEYYTREPYIAAARAVLGSIDLDPASHWNANRIVQADRYLTIQDEALHLEWRAKTVWLNPPYSLQSEFIPKLIRHFEAGDIGAAIALVSNRAVSARYFAPMWNYLLCFTDHRLKFDGPDGQGEAAQFGHVFCYLGPDQAAFAGVFTRFGAVVHRWMESA